MNKFELINNKNYLHYCQKKIEKFTSIIISNDFEEFKLTLYSLDKYYKKKFLISSNNGNANYFICASENYKNNEIIEMTEALCNTHTFRRQCPHYPVTTEYGLEIFDDYKYRMDVDFFNLEEYNLD